MIPCCPARRRPPRRARGPGGPITETGSARLPGATLTGQSSLLKVKLKNQYEDNQESRGGLTLKLPHRPAIRRELRAGPFPRASHGGHRVGRRAAAGSDPAWGLSGAAAQLH